MQHTRGFGTHRLAVHNQRIRNLSRQLVRGLRPGRYKRWRAKHAPRAKTPSTP